MNRDYRVLEQYSGTIHYKPMRGYNGRKIRAILTKLGSIAPLPKKNSQITIIKSKGIRVDLINSGTDYYFSESLIPQIHRESVKAEPKRELNVEDVRKWLGLPERNRIN